MVSMDRLISNRNRLWGPLSSNETLNVEEVGPSDKVTMASQKTDGGGERKVSYTIEGTVQGTRYALASTWQKAAMAQELIPHFVDPYMLLEE